MDGFKKHIKPIYLIIVLFYFINPYFLSSQYNFDNTGGKLQNNGIIRVKSGHTRGLPDTVGGKIEFLFNVPNLFQEFPGVTYNKILISGASNKDIAPVRTEPLTSLDSIWILNNAILLTKESGVDARASVVNEAYVKGLKQFRIINEDKSQNIQGRGEFNILNIDNPNGVDIVNSGGFLVSKKLELSRGELRNTSENNFRMGDSAWIVRHTGASLSTEPVFDKTVNVQYVGNGEMQSSGELPSDSTVLQILKVENKGGVTLTKDVTVNDTLLLADVIRTEPDSNNKFVLTYTNPTKDPIFTTPDAEIDGSFRRKFLRFDSSRLIFNNPYTYAIIENPQAAGSMKEMTFRVKPRTFPPFLNGTSKVKRSFEISARDENFNLVQTGMNITLGWGWRHLADTNDARHETNSLQVPNLRLQRWVNNEWYDLEKAEDAQTDPSGWGSGYTTNINALGHFAIGMPGNLYLLALKALVYLEGAYRYGSMADDLNRRGLIPKTPPDIYPYNLDPKRTQYFVDVVPDSVIDWIVVEFRNKNTNLKNQYLTCFLRSDGKIVNRKGVYPVNLYNEGIDSGEYYIAVRHRNHLAIVTEEPVRVYPETRDALIDFTKPEILLGRTSAAKPIGFNADGSLLFGLYAGDVNADGVIDFNDLIITWDQRDLEGYLIPDVNLSGIVTTKDFNFPWNNRGIKSTVP
ncbi:MAG: hypothetical protein N2319_09135 [Candidatus Kapabacteria bacterium]|nr:hypothetical protein [Candidatus Kapabacteria bacterium]